MTSGGHPCVLPSSSLCRSRSQLLPSVPVAPRAATPPHPLPPSAAAACDQKIGMFGALTGPNANLGIYIQNGVNLALDDYNKKNPNCKVALENYDSQGDPDQAPALAKKAIDDKKIVGIVGPAFSGESKAADPAFAEAGLVHITPSATNPKLADERLEDLLPRSRQRRRPRVPRPPSTSRTPSRRRRSSSSTTRPSTARAWPTSSARTSAPPSSATTPSREADRLQRLGHQGDGLGC